MMATLEKSTAERNCQTLGRCRGESYRHTLNPDPRGHSGKPRHPGLFGEVMNSVGGIQSQAQ